MTKTVVNLLGQFALYVDDKPVHVSYKAKELISFLALQPNRRAHRERVSGILWPEIPDERALRNLSTLLWRLRGLLAQTTETDFLQMTRAIVGLHQNRMTVDYWDFEACSAQLGNSYADLESAKRALDLYKGDLLEGELDSDWLLAERERIRRIYLAILKSTAKAHGDQGRVTDALLVYQRLLDVDPLNEEVCREAMRLQLHSGNTTEALRLYTVLAHRLRSELGILPEAATEQLKEDIKVRRSTANPSDRHSSSPRVPGEHTKMVGRKEELNRLRHGWFDACQSQLVVVGIEGEAGVGKTRLVAEFSRQVSEAGGKIFTSVCDEVLSARPYAAILRLATAPHQLVSDRIQFGAELELSLFSEQFRSLGSPKPEGYNPTLESEARARFFEVTASSLRERSRDKPALVIVEDLHHIDSASLDLLSYLVRELRDSALMMVLTWRHEDSPQRVERLIRSRGLFQTVLRLSRLTRLQTHELCEEIVGSIQIPHAVLELVHRESEGNPLFAVEILRLLHGEKYDDWRWPWGIDEELYLDAIGRFSSSDRIPSGIRGVVKKRLTKLPRSARQLLQFASTCGRVLDLDLLSRVMDVSRDDVRRSVQALCRLGFIGSFGASYEFLHDKVRAFCYEELPSPDRSLIHRRILKVLEEAFPDRLEELAYHSERSGEPTKASMYWESVGDRASVVWAHQDAVTAYTRACDNLRVAGASAWSRVAYELLKKRASAWEAQGSIENGAADIGEMLKRSREAKDDYRICEAMAFQSRLLIRRGMYEQAIATASEALRLAKVLEHAGLEARAREALAFSLYRSGNDIEAERMLLELDPVLQQITDNECRERVWNRIASLRAGRGDIRALSSLDNAEKCWAGNLFERGVRNLLRGTIFAHMGRRDEARLNTELAEVEFRRAGNLSAVAMTNSILSVILACGGDLGGAVRYARKGLPFKSGKTDRYWKVVSSTNICHGLLLGLGSLALAKRMSRRVLQQIPQIEGRSRGNLLDLIAAIALEEGDLELAQRLVVEAIREVEADPGVSRGEFLSTLGRIALAQGRVAEAMENLEDAVRILEGGILYLEFVQALSNLGVAMKGIGRVQEACSYSQRAMNLLRSRNDFAYRPQEVYWNHFLVMQGITDRIAVNALGKAYRIVFQRSAQLGTRMRVRYLAIPLNRAIVATWERRLGAGKPIQPPGTDLVPSKASSGGATKVNIVIPRTGAPWGRPLRAEDLAEVILTTDAGRQDELLKESKGEIGLRRGRILRLCAEANVQGGDMREEDLARVLGVSTRTIRGDIAYLRAQGCSLQTRATTMH